MRNLRWALAAADVLGGGAGLVLGMEGRRRDRAATVAPWIGRRAAGITLERRTF